jgi:hypothetical protein
MFHVTSFTSEFPATPQNSNIVTSFASPLLFAAALALATTAGAGIYKWTDKDGRVHYSDNAADGAVAKEVAIEKSSQPVVRSAYDRRREGLAATCREARRHLAALENSKNKAYKNDGLAPRRLVPLTPGERVEAIENDRKYADQRCREL